MARITCYLALSSFTFTLSPSVYLLASPFLPQKVTIIHVVLIVVVKVNCDGAKENNSKQVSVINQACNVYYCSR